MSTEFSPSNRTIVTRSPSRTVRVINLPYLLPHAVEAESSLEARFIHRAAFLPGTREILHQPFSLPITERGYRPDFLHTIEQEKPVVVEVKPTKKLRKYEGTFDRAAELLARENYCFYVITEAELERDAIDERALLLRRYGKATFPAQECVRVSETLTEYSDGLPLGSLLRKTRVSRELIIHLVARKILSTGFRLLVDHSARVRLCALHGNSFTFASWFRVRAWGSRGV